MEYIKRFREPKTYTERRNYVTKKNKFDQLALQSQKKKESTNALIFDNGGSSIKIGYTKNESPKILPNHIMKAKSERKRCFIADQIDDCRDLSGLYYLMTHENGYITKYDVQKTVWDYAFHKFPIEDSPVIMTQPIFNFKHIQEYIDEIFFEEYDVKMLYRSNATDFSKYQYINKIKGSETPCIVVDSGFSFTHVVPYIKGKKYTAGIVRMDIGGKLLTNYLKDILSYRQLHVMEETYVINQLKEDTCFMSYDFKRDMQTAKTTNTIVKNYVLPDFHNIRRGYVQEKETANEFAENCQILRINNERICVPEILMKPSIITGMEQAGLAQCIAKCISKCPEKYHKLLSDNIVLTGGNCMFQGFKERLELETRMFLPSHHKLSIYKPDDPLNFSWYGGKSISMDPNFKQFCVKKQDYEEHGSNYTYKMFNNFTKFEENRPKSKIEKTFSYLDYWKKEGVDIFQKNEQPTISTNDVQFILEGDGIDDYDGKYVNIEFEYEKKVQQTLKEIPKNVFKSPDLQAPRIFKRKKLIPKVETIFSETNCDLANSTHINKQSVNKVYKPIFRQKLDNQTTKSETKLTQIISLSNTIPLSHTSTTMVIPNKNTKAVTINSPQLLNNTVILPQNMLTSKNVTLQLIPFRPELLRQGGNFIIAKKK